MISLSFLSGRRGRGFTLVELLVVIVIIGILAAMTLGGAKFAQKKAKKSRAEGEIAAFSTALERYKIDNGNYPLTVQIQLNGTNYDGKVHSMEYATNATYLYQALSGKTNANDLSTAPFYVEFASNQLVTNEGITYVIDPFQNPYGFISCNGENGQTNDVLYNQGLFDLWSTAGETGEGKLTNSDAWENNWSK